MPPPAEAPPEVVTPPPVVHPTPTDGGRDARAVLLEHLVDDASLFPPESAPVAQAVRRHADVRSGPRAWLQGRFLVPASRVAELGRAVAAELGEDAPDWPLAVVVDGVPEGDDGTVVREVLARLLDDLAADDAVVDGDRVPGPDVLRLAALEVALPAGAETAAVDALAAAMRSLDLLGAASVPVWLEVSLDGGAAQVRERVRSVLARAAVHDLGGADGAGLKVRCGGTSPGSVPPAAAVAAALGTALAAGAPVKATAGLHSAHGRTDPVTGDDQHGFLGVLGGALLVAAGLLDEAGLAAAVADRDPAALRLDADGLHRRTEAGVVSADVAQLAAARPRVPSFGSCSLDEPVEALESLGVLPLAGGPS